ncbi:uncharacterized protein [Centruroides vittatus]|uniref:uncharacterized protein n=1 Tax=Centruroides vittatus TaxID=120091 RepID=UPI00350F3010
MPKRGKSRGFRAIDWDDDEPGTSGVHNGNRQEDGSRGEGSPTMGRGPNVTRDRSRDELEGLRLQIELEKIKQETARIELERNRQRNEARHSENSAVKENFDDYARRVKGALPKMPEGEEAVPSWFRTVEIVLETYEVPEELRGQIVLSVLSERCKAALTRLSVDQVRHYPSLKQFILEELRLSPAEYLKGFRRAERYGGETWSQFASRLKDLYEYYVDSREVKTREELIELTVADHLKSVLPHDARKYVTLQEGKGWSKPAELAKFIEKFAEASGGNLGNKKEENRNQRDTQGEMARKPDPVTRNTSERTPRASCYSCGKAGHWKRECPNRKATSVPKQARLVSASKTPETENHLVARVTAYDRPEAGESPNRIKLVCGGNRLSAIVDSGAEISVIREAMVPASVMETKGEIQLVGAFGHRVNAVLATFPIELWEESSPKSQGPVLVTCAVTGELNQSTDALLSEEDYRTLLDRKRELQGKGGRHIRNVRIKGSGLSQGKEPEPHPGAAGGRDEDSEGDGTDLRDAQVRDDSLSRLWEAAKHGKDGLVVNDGILYRRDSWFGRPIKQVVVPQERRAEVLSLAHKTPWGGHLGSRKTAGRIREVFYWPGMAADIRRYCQSCHRCQIRAPARILDRTPITPLTRPSTPFQVVNIDMIGPIEPPSSRGHRYALCMIDLCTRWPEVEPMRSLSATATCSTLLQVFTRTGFPELICCDQGTNFTAGLTREMTRLLGVRIRFSTPEHPQSNGSVERWNQTFKNMLSHTIAESKKNWDKVIPFLLWAYREVPHETTGISPFEMLYGRAPVGPLAILKRVWTGSVTPPDSLNNKAAAYLQTLVERIKAVREIATEHTAVKQNQYATNYNLRARPKEFSIGDTVLVRKTYPDNKTDDRWEGPAIVERREREGSYRIRLEDGRTKWVHVDRLRKYQRQICAVGVVFDSDASFGEIVETPSTRQLHDRGRKSGEIGEIPAHLPASAQTGLRKVLEEFHSVFGSKPGKTNLVTHRITLIEGWTPKRFAPYRIPQALRNKVDETIGELLDAKLIRPSVSECAHPIVCVAKKGGGMRLCVDYRHLNAATVPDRYPMVPSAELVYQLAEARYITSLDLCRGYWQVRLEDECKHLTAFVTHRGQYEWEVMPFGLRNAAATFQRLMDLVLAPFNDFAVAYIDDVAIYSRSWEEHLTHLKAVLRALRDAGLTVNANKCQFARPRLLYLGHIVGSGRHAPDPERVKAITALALPKTKEQLRSFLGICGYYRDYISDFAKLTNPLTNLLARRAPKTIEWNRELERSFEAVKTKLGQAPLLYSPDPERPFVLFTDASNHAIGVCLAQFSPEGQEKPIAFASRKLKGAEIRWATIEKEAYAIIWGLHKFNYWIYGRPVTVVTDHNPLKYLTLSTPQSAKLTRWALALQGYDMRIEYRKGKLHGNADALSRLESDGEGRISVRGGGESLPGCSGERVSPIGTDHRDL